jgi:protein SCO1/2
MGRRFILLLACLAAGCRAGPKPVVHRYQLEGTVLAVNPDSRRIVVQHGDIPGFMPAMTMPYPLGDAENLGRLETGDRIRADVVVEGAGTGYLEHVTVVGRAARSR